MTPQTSLLDEKRDFRDFCINLPFQTYILNNFISGVGGRELPGGRTEGAWDYIFIRLRTTMSSLKMSPMAQDYMSPWDRAERDT